ncbi:MAG: FtsX-like permease family protein [Pseudomonadota bacterium]
MFRHLLKLIWKRKGRNMMLSLEILLAFVIVFGIAAFGLRNYQLYQLPTGFNSDDVWSVVIRGSGDARLPQDTYDKFKNGLLALPGAKQVAFASSPPYSNSNYRTGFKTADGRKIRTEIVLITDDFMSMMGIDVTHGRAFDRTDDGAGVAPVIINRRLALELFGTTDVLGKQFDSSEKGSDGTSMKRVIGLIDDFRKKGELDSPGNVTIARHFDKSEFSVRTILIKMAPGTPRAFEETLNRQLKMINNEWSYQIAPLSALRKEAINEKLTPILVLSVIAFFLLLMVAFGLFGVLWQNTTRRIPEIGLRRAIGANAGNIYRQIIGEQFLLSSGAMLVALLLLVQLPITDAMGDSLNWTVFLSATAVSMTVIYLLSLLCSVYPGWRASRLSPTEALHYE